MKSMDIDDDLKEQIPSTESERIQELNKLNLKEKFNFLPPSGLRFNMGPYVYEVTFVNPSKLRFSSKLVDVIIEGVNDGKANIINPHTGESFENR
jgi:hypothetical protein